MKFTWGDTEYDFDTNQLSYTEAKTIKRHTGLTVGQFEQGCRFAVLDPDALVAMLYLAKVRAGEDVSFGDFEDVNLMQLIESLMQGRVDELNTAAEGNVDEPAAQDAPTEASAETGDE